MDLKAQVGVDGWGDCLNGRQTNMDGVDDLRCLNVF